MIEIREVRAAEVLEQIAELTKSNWDETGFEFELNLKPEVFDSLQATGLWFALCAFHDGVIVGYSTASVVPHHLNTSHVVCASDALFVDPKFRGGLLPARLIKATEDLARSKGAVEICWHTRAGTGLAKVLERRGYIPADVVVSRRL